MAKKKAPTTTANNKKKAAAAPKGNSKEKEVLLVGSKVKAALREYEVNVGEGTLDQLNAMMYWHIDQAARRAKENGRKTVRGKDVLV